MQQPAPVERPRLLYLTHELPLALDAGHKLRFRQLLDAFAGSFDTTIAGFVEPSGARDVVRRERLGEAAVIAAPHSIRIRRRPLRLAATLGASLLGGQAYSMRKFASRRLAASLQGWRAEAPPDLVVATLPMTSYLALFPGVPRVLDCHNIESRLWADFARALPAPLRWFARREGGMLARRERDVWASVEGVITICAEDTDIILTAAQTANVLTVAPVVSPRSGAPATSLPRVDVGMLGVWSWAPNEHALERFASDIAPRLAQAGLTARVSGPGMSAALRRRLRRQAVEVTGYLPDVRAFYASVDQVLAPYWQGGGVRLKVLEALAYGVPVVGTPLAFRGVAAGGEALAIASDPSGMVDLVLKNHAHLPRATAAAAVLRAKVLAHHDPAHGAARVADFLRRVAV